MNKYTFFCFIIWFFIITLSFSQNLEVIYNISIEPKKTLLNLPENIPKETIELVNKSQEYFSSFTFTLNASFNEAIFFNQNKMETDIGNFSYGLAKILLETDSKFYYNIEQNTISKGFEAYGMKLITQKKITDIKWKLSKESKFIEGFKCFKATYTYDVTNVKGSFKKTVIAWYSPIIKYNFGPKGFSGLPGLILILIDDNITYYASKIKEKKSVKIEKITNGKLVSEKELKKIGDRVRRNREAYLRN
jgi:GLPGLI family protein